MTCVIYRSAETTVRTGPVIYRQQERLTHVRLSYLAVLRQEVVLTNDNSPLILILSRCITVPFEGPSSLLESA